MRVWWFIVGLGLLALLAGGGVWSSRSVVPVQPIPEIVNPADEYAWQVLGHLPKTWRDSQTMDKKEGK